LPNPPPRSEKKYSSVPSNEIDGALSKVELLTPAPRLTGVDHGLLKSSRVDIHRS